MLITAECGPYTNGHVQHEPLLPSSHEGVNQFPPKSWDRKEEQRQEEMIENRRPYLTLDPGN